MKPDKPITRRGFVAGTLATGAAAALPAAAEAAKRKKHHPKKHRTAAGKTRRNRSAMTPLLAPVRAVRRPTW